jgi:hypothetical protein
MTKSWYNMIQAWYLKFGISSTCPILFWTSYLACFGINNLGTKYSRARILLFQLGCLIWNEKSQWIAMKPRIAENKYGTKKGEEICRSSVQGCFTHYPNEYEVHTKGRNRNKSTVTENKILKKGEEICHSSVQGCFTSSSCSYSPPPSPLPKWVWSPYERKKLQ